MEQTLEDKIQKKLDLKRSQELAVLLKQLSESLVKNRQSDEKFIASIENNERTIFSFISKLSEVSAPKVEVLAGDVNIDMKQLEFIISDFSEKILESNASVIQSLNMRRYPTKLKVVHGPFGEIDFINIEYK